MLVLLNALQAGNRSGTGRYVRELVRWLPMLTDDFDIAAAWPRDLPRAQHEQEGRVAYLVRDAYPAWRRLLYDQLGIRSDQRSLRANIIHYPANIGSLSEIHNMVLTVHDLSFVRNPAWFRKGRAAYYRYAVRTSVHYARRIIADSRATAIDLCERFQAPEDKIDVVPLGVDSQFQPASPEAQTAIREKFHLPEQFFLYMGTLEPRKNLPRLIRAWDHIAGTCSFDLVIAGRDGWKTKPIYEAAASAIHAKRIHFPGFIEETDQPALLSAATAFVWPSLWEGFGLPLLEAMACGTPVLTSNVASIPEVVDDAALTVNPEDEEAIADALLRLAENSTLCTDLARRGSARAEQFTWLHTAELTLDSYRSMLNL